MNNSKDDRLALNAYATKFWQGRKAEPSAKAGTDDDDTSDLVPQPITSEQAFANFHGKYVARGKRL